MSRKAKLDTSAFYSVIFSKANPIPPATLPVKKSSAFQSQVPPAKAIAVPFATPPVKKSSAVRSQVPTVRNADDFFTYYLLKASVKINSVPTPTVLTTSIVSLCACKISLVIESPRPEPFLSRPRDASDL